MRFFQQPAGSSNTVTRAGAPGRRHRGFTMIEVLVALVVLTVGMLGVAVLYVEGLRLNRTSIYRTLAVGLASDMADRIRANAGVPASYAGTGPGINNQCVNGLARCTPAQLAADDWFRWWREVQDHLPGGVQANIDVRQQGGMDVYDITIEWREPGRDDPVGFTLPVQVLPT